MTRRPLLWRVSFPNMKPSLVYPALLAAAVAVTTSSALDFGSGNGVVQTAGTVMPNPAMDKSNPTSGTNGFGMPATSTSWTPPSGAQASGSGTNWTPPGKGGQGAGWPPGPSTFWAPPGKGGQGQGWPSGSTTYWAPPGQGGQGQGWLSASGAGWTPPGNPDPANPSGSQGLETLSVDCSGSDAGGWTKPSEGSGTLDVDCSGSSEGSDTLGVDCSGSSTGGLTQSNEGSGTLDVECSRSSAGELTQSSEGSGTLGIECSGSSDEESGPLSGSGGGELPAGSENSLRGSTSAEAPTETPASSMEGSDNTESATPSASGTGEQGSLPSSTGDSSETEASGMESGTEDAGSQPLRRAPHRGPKLKRLAALKTQGCLTSPRLLRQLLGHRLLKCCNPSRVKSLCAN